MSGMPKPGPMPSDPRRTPPDRLRTHEDRAQRGTLVAVTLGAAFALMIGVIVLTQSSGPVISPATVTPPVPRPPDTTGPASTAQADIVGLTDVRIELLDRDDPSRTAGLLTFASMDPIEGRQYAVDRPDGLIFTRDGGAVRLRARSGRLHMPDRTREPESGRLSGDVIVEFFQRRADGRRIDPAADTPSATLRSPSLSFDTAVGSITTDEAFTVTSEQVDLTGRGLTIIFNRAAQRLELLEIAMGQRMTIRPTRATPVASSTLPATGASDGAGADRASAGADGMTSGAIAGPPARTPVLAYYAVSFARDVRLTQASRVLKADDLRLWARLEDNRLPEGAIAPIRIAARPGRSPMPASGQTRHVGASAQGAQSSVSAPASSVADAAGVTVAEPSQESDALVLEWAGACVLEPVSDRPHELGRDQVALRFTAEQRGFVDFADNGPSALDGASARARAIDYGATSRRLVLDGDETTDATLDVPSYGSVAARRIEADLAAGLVRMPGRSVMRLFPASGETRAGSITATEQTDLRFETVDGSLTGALRQASFSGAVVLRDDAGVVAADFLRADFVAAGDRPTALARVVAEGRVEASADRGGVRAQRVDVSFDPASDRTEPRALTAEGEASVWREEQSLSARSIEADLSRGPRGEIDVTAVRAEGAVQFRDSRDATFALADRLLGQQAWVFVDLASELEGPPQPVRDARVDLLGSRVSLGRGDELALTAAQVRLTGQGPSIEVFGPGELAWGQGGLPGGRAIVATWNSGLSFDDGAGTLTAAGSTVIDRADTVLSRDRIEADVIRATLTPRPAAGQSDEPRRLLSAEAQGQDGQHAWVEARRLSAIASETFEGPPEPALAQLVYLQGPRIAIDAARDRLDVPSAGRLLIRDARGREEPFPSTAAEPAPDARGDALFDWDGSLAYDRAAGEIEMLRAVRLTHRRLMDGMVTNLRCDRIVATIAPADDTDPATPDARLQQSQLTRVSALGSVWIGSGPEARPGEPNPPMRELSADAADYDTTRGIITARANPGQTVTFLDSASAAPVSAASIVWNLTDNRVSVTDPAPIIAPRPR